MARLRETSPRRRLWAFVLGGDPEAPHNTLRLESDRIIEGTTPSGHHARFYKADVATLSSEQRLRLAGVMVRSFPFLTVREVLRELDGPHGLPVLVDDVEVLS
jgi:hypothetical protein